MSVVAATSTMSTTPITHSSVASSTTQTRAPIIPAADSTAAFNWAGYVASGGTYSSVSATWVVPAVRNPTGDGADATWVGIGGVGTHDLIQAGTEALPEDGGGIVYAAWYEALPGDSKMVPLTVSPGDTVAISVHEESADHWIIDFHNQTTGETYQKRLAYASSKSSAEWIEEMPVSPDQPITLDDFGTVHFTSGATVADGTNMTIREADAQPLRMDNSDHETLAAPSELGEDGAGFSVTRTDALATPLQFVRHPRVPQTRVVSEEHTAPVQTFEGDGWSITVVQLLSD